MIGFHVVGSVEQDKDYRIYLLGYGYSVRQNNAYSSSNIL